MPIIRGSLYLHRQCTVSVEAYSSGLTTCKFEILDPIVEFVPGERFTFVELRLLNNGIQMSDTSMWMPVRELTLSLQVEPELDADGCEMPVVFFVRRTGDLIHGCSSTLATHAWLLRW